MISPRVARWVWAVVVGAVLATRLLAGQPPGSLTGVVRDPSGKPVPAVWIAREGFKDRSGGTPWWRSDVDGRFKIEGLPEGEVVLRVVPGEAHLGHGFLVRAAAGQTDVPIVVDPGPQVFLRIADYQAPKGEPRYARLVWQEADGRRPVRYAPVAPDGRIRFVQLPATASFELWGAAGPGRPVHVVGLHAGDAEVSVQPTKGRTISGRVLLREGESPQRAEVVVTAFPGFHVGRSSIAADGTFTVGDLPEGKYTVTASFVAGEMSMPVKAQAEAGAANVVLDLRP